MRRHHPLVLAAALAALVAPAPATAQDATPGPQPATFQAGFAVRNITPTAALSEDGQGNVYLGGFGLGPHRLSDGVKHPIKVRAAVFGDGEDAVALASVEVQGSFAAYRGGDYGWWDVIERVSADTGLTRDDVMISSDHSHRAPDTTGAWGFVPEAYARFVADQTEAAIEEAYARAHDGDAEHLEVGTADGRNLLSSDFSFPSASGVDRPIRVLVARDAETGRIEGVYGEFAAHPTIEGSATPMSPDWPGVVSDMVTGNTTAPTVLAVGAIGRTHSDDPPGVDTDFQWELELSRRVQEAVASAEPLTRSGVESDTDMISLAAWNVGLLALGSAGEAGCRAHPPAPHEACVPIQRARTPPWQAGNVVRTLVSTARVGDVMLWGAPGELYPNAHFFVQAAVDARAHFIQGLTNDQLGYLIAPTEVWPRVLANAANSDNALFNVAPASGDHLACAALDAAEEVGFSVDQPREAGLEGTPLALSRCQAWAAEDRSLPGNRGPLGFGVPAAG